MSAHFDKLLRISSEAVALSAPELPSSIAGIDTEILDELRSLLRERNGFYAFESALHVFHASSTGDTYGINEWNTHDLWKHSYNGLTDGCVFFAEDVFGAQFGIKERSIVSFDPETAAFQHLAESVSEWVRVLLSDWRVLTGHPLAHEWQVNHGPIPAGYRLVPIVPFVAGGEFNVQNLHLLEAAKGMRLRGEIALQLKNLPDRAKIKLVVSE